MSRLFLLLFLFSHSVFSQKKDAMYFYNLAEKNSAEGNLRNAYENYYKAAELCKNYLYYVKAAEAYYLSHNNSKEKNRKKTESLYNKSFSLKAWNSEGLLSRAGYNLYLPRYKSAMSDLDSLLVRDSSNIKGYLLKASIYMDKKDTVNAYKVYDLAIKNSSESELGKIYIEKAFRCYSQGFWKRCIESYYKALKLMGKEKFTSFSYCNLSSALYEIGDDDNACYYFKLCDISTRPTLYDKEALLKLCK